MHCCRSQHDTCRHHAHKGLSRSLQGTCGFSCCCSHEHDQASLAPAVLYGLPTMFQPTWHIAGHYVPASHLTRRPWPNTYCETFQNSVTAKLAGCLIRQKPFCAQCTFTFHVLLCAALMHCHQTGRVTELLISLLDAFSARQKLMRVYLLLYMMLCMQLYMLH